MEQRVEELYVFDKFLYLDSRDRGTLLPDTFVETLQPVNNFLMYNQVIESGFTHIAVHSAKIDNLMRNINEYNNKIIISITTYTVPQGIYTVDTLITAINLAILASGVVLTKDAFGFITISAPGSFTWQSGNINSDPYILLTMLGFIQYPLTGSSSYTGTQLPNILYTRFIDIESYKLTAYSGSYISSSYKSRNNVLRIFLSQDSSTATYENRLLTKFVFEETAVVGTIDIQLKDEWGLPLIFNGDFLLNLMLFKKSNKNMSRFQI